MEGRDRRIQRLGHPAHRGGAHPAPQDGEQRFADFAGRKAEDKGSQDHPVDLRGAPCIGSQDVAGTKPASARHGDLEVAQLTQQMTVVEAVAPVRFIVGSKPFKPALDRGRHLFFDDLSQGLAADVAVAFAPFQAIAAHRLHELERHG